MRQGVVVMVRNIGWYSELPDDAVVKVEDIDDIEEKISTLLAEPSKMKEISIRAMEYVRRYHSHYNYVQGMVESINPVGYENSEASIINRAIKEGVIKTKADLLKARGV